MKRFSTRAVVVAAIAALTAGLVGPGVASAAPTGSGAVNFAAQAKVAGLTPAEAAAVQREVDRWLANTGGTQVTINKIELKGAEVLVALPGETVAREYNAIAAFGCPVNRFCAYRYENFTGSQVNAWSCSTDYPLTDFATMGSYVNNQSPAVNGPYARFLNLGHGQIGTSLRSYAIDSSYWWAPVWFIDPC